MIVGFISEVFLSHLVMVTSYDLYERNSVSNQRQLDCLASSLFNITAQNDQSSASLDGERQIPLAKGL